MMALEAVLKGRLRELQQLRREIEGSKGEGKRRGRGDGADEPEPEVQVLQHQLQLGTVQERASGMKDTMLALRFQAVEMQAWEEFWKPVVPPVPQRNNSKALEEFWKPVPVPQRNKSKSKINWEQILIALTSWLVPYISFWTQLPVNNLIHIVGAISVLWILLSTV